ncbi:hypothetical protein DM02DRAFT_521838 [Periconia macrospinosa]|uniref:Uncharacterized protein n=1 Tax=Periconia macrospinosa TaxID=97972 RepID=A0A2V1DXQ0_9PLEO|nr:hypothetical protein DM02DRAFT_521838 [Periconia macrospinosa]
MSVVTEERTAIEIHTLSGPENSALPSNVFIRWNHLYAEYLDWMQFQSACLAVPDLSDRIQKLLKKLFMKIEEKGILKTYLNGMFVEPGTVLRADESDESSNQNDLQSVIFSCVPYFDISNTSDPPPGLVDLVYPARTLMEAYYPNKPVQDRDDEQAFRKFGNKRNAGLVHVPSLWMVNIGSQAVVTCGYRSLASEFQKSIIVVSDDIKQLSLGMKENKTTTIRLTDWDKRPLIYQRDECRTYFEMERKLRELRFSPGKDRNSLQLLTNTRNGLRKVTPAIWPSLVSQKNVIFVDVFVTNDPELNKIDKDLEVEDLQPPGLATVPPYSVPPFFHWPIASNEKNDAKSAMPADADRPMRCLTRVENDLIDLGVLESTTIGAVDETFTSSTYYEGLPEVKFADFVKSFISRPKSSNITNEHSLHAPFHKRYMEKYCSKFVKETAEFVDIVCETLGLFVSNMDNSILLRKLWGSMTNLVHVAERMAKMEPCEVDSQEYLDPNWRPRLSKDPSWWIRKGRASIPLPAPNGKKNFAATVKSCRKCKRYMFKSLDEALEHLRSAHLEENPPGRDSSSGQLHPNANETKELREWITNGDEWVIESTIYSATAVLSAATKKARHFLNLLHELSDGVRNEDGELSPLYALPGKLLDTFHQLVLLYFAVERSLHYIEEDTKVDKKSGMFAKGTDLEKLEKNSAILQRFSDDVRTPLVRAREDLCNMARSTTPTAVEERLSLGPEYICSWVMRKLIVKPLKNSMTIADMYNDYLLTIEFQVSHRPGKRLLRSIKLIQEEIKILQIVIAWQTRQITNYIKVLDYLTYPTSSALLPSRRVMFPLEYSLLASCLESLDMMRADLIDQYLRGDPLSDTAKQSAEINEEDHGKAIFVFTVVTAIFLPLSFITSYLGMNTADIRDMENNQTLFWEIAAPLTAVVMGAVVFVAYNGDELRDLFSSMYRTLTGKQPRDTLTRGISAAQRKRAAQAAILHSSTTLNTNKELAEKAEYGIPYPLRTESGFPYSQIKSSPPLAPNITLNNAYVRPPSPGFRHVAPPEPAVRNLRVRNSSYRRPTYENGLDYVDNSNDDYNRTHYKSRTKPIAMPPPLYVYV